jgi:hypothetical protein
MLDTDTISRDCRVIAMNLKDQKELLSIITEADIIGIHKKGSEQTILSKDAHFHLKEALEYYIERCKHELVSTDRIDDPGENEIPFAPRKR